ncbi:phosphoketolase family protein [Gordonia humi]|uniref:phosphoketolase family protein n=1 Tax=Gordonia humi TaxID=686429 RepID=UPI001FE852E9|nr:phosphoketolase family protein [Gordonia humi]
MPDYSSADIDADLRWWNAANYLTVAQIYLQGNVLLRSELTPSDIKPRLLGHWGTSPGLSAIYTVLNRLIKRTESRWLFVTGPGHGGPALIANVYLEGTYSEIYPDVGRDEQGLLRLCRQFSTPGGVPSHVSVETPGSIHEGGELGYSLAHAVGAALDSPDLVVACVVGDGEAETGPLSASWNSTAFLNPARDGAVLPVLHLNDAKISGPTVMGRRADADVRADLHGKGWEPVFVEGTDPRDVFVQLTEAVGAAYEDIRRIQTEARAGTDRPAPRWPAIVMRTPKGWTGPRRVDGHLVEGTHRAHQVPLSGVRDDPARLRQLDAWLRSYRPDELFDDRGAVVDDVSVLAPDGSLRMGSTPYANGGLRREPLTLPDPAPYSLRIDTPGTVTYPTTTVLGEYLRDVYRADRTTDDGGTFRLFCPDETASNKLDAVFEATERCWQLPASSDDDHLAPSGRVMEVLSEHLCQGWLEGYLLSGRHGLFASYEAFAMISASMVVQHTKWLQHAAGLGWREPVSSLNILLTSTCWRNDHNGFSHQGPGLIDTVLSLSPGVVRVWLPPDANSLLAVSKRCLESRDQVNLIVADKQPHLQYLTDEEATTQTSAGASIWHWAGNESDGAAPDVVLACAGDVPTHETLAAASLLREHMPALRTRVVNIIDLMALLPPGEHPHGLSDAEFADVFTTTVDVVVAFHGYPRALHQLLHGRPDAGRFHVRGFSEQGTTTTPFDMVVLNRMSRYHLVLEAIRRAGADSEDAERLARLCRSQLERHHSYIRRHFDDLPEIRDWTWA